MNTEDFLIAVEDFLIAVMARDRPGIVATVTEAVFHLGGNVTELSQTVMGGYFSLILRAACPQGLAPAVIRERLEAARPELGLCVCVQRRKPTPAFSPAPGTPVYFLTVEGRDRPGLIAEVTRALSERRVNIEDLYTRSEEERITMIFQIQPADSASAERLRADLPTIGADLGVSTHLLHRDILRATSEVGAIRRLVQP